LVNFDHHQTLDTFNKALKIMLKLALPNKMLDAFLGRIYEEKGHVLKGLGGSHVMVNE